MVSPSYYRGFNIILACFHHRTVCGFTIVLSYFHHRNIMFSPLYYRGFIIVLSCFHHCSIIVLLSYYRGFIIASYLIFTFVVSCFHHYTIVIHHCTIMVSLSHYRIFTIVLSVSSSYYSVVSPLYYHDFTIRNYVFTIILYSAKIKCTQNS